MLCRGKIVNLYSNFFSDEVYLEKAVSAFDPHIVSLHDCRRDMHCLSVKARITPSVPIGDRLNICA